MKQYTIITILITILFSCTTNFKVVNGNIPLNNNELNCTFLYSLIKKSWSKHDKYHCYKYNQKLINEIRKTENYACFDGLTANQIVGLFGEPTSISNENISYSVGKVCGEGEYPSIYLLKFSIHNDRVSNVQFSKIFDD